MANNYFQFKQFMIQQDSCAMKVGTDGVLLGAWADLKNTNSILDIGTGTGLIALMTAQRSTANITAIEISPSAFLQAKENIQNSPWNDRIKILQDSIQNYAEETKYRFDLIICNPPFFQHSKKVAKDDRSIARQDITLTFETLLDCTKKLLNENGRSCFIIPVEKEQLFSEKARSKELFLNKKTIVKPTAIKTPKRVLLELSKNKSELFQSELIIEKDKRHQYTSEYIELTNDFYLNF